MPQGARPSGPVDFATLLGDQYPPQRATLAMLASQQQLMQQLLSRDRGSGSTDPWSGAIHGPESEVGGKMTGARGSAARATWKDWSRNHPTELLNQVRRKLAEALDL